MSLQTLFITDLKPLFPRGFISNKTDILITLVCLLYPLSQMVPNVKGEEGCRLLHIFKPHPDTQQLHLIIIKEAWASGEKLNSETEQEVWKQTVGTWERWCCLSEGKSSHSKWYRFTWCLEWVDSWWRLKQGCGCLFLPSYLKWLKAWVRLPPELHALRAGMEHYRNLQRAWLRVTGTGTHKHL